MRRIIFKKCEEIKYISHLDLMRAFNRMLLRAEIPVKYSEGFNPHMLLNFALPLSVGMTSERDFAEISLTSEMSNEDVKDKLIKAAPAGIVITDVTDAAEPRFKDIAKAEFTLEIHCNKKAEDFLRYLNLPEIITEKKTKKGIKEVDIKPMILSCEAYDTEDGRIALRLMLAAGNTANLNPSLVMKAAEGCIDGLELELVNTVRENLYTESNVRF